MQGEFTEIYSVNANWPIRLDIFSLPKNFLFNKACIIRRDLLIRRVFVDVVYFIEDEGILLDV